MKFKPKFDHILTKDYLLEEYIKNDRSIKSLCKEVGCTNHTLYNYVDKFGLRRNKQGQIQSGQKFDKLITIKQIGKRKNGAIIWECQCNCGNLAYVDTGSLKSKKSKSCGCNRNRLKSDHPSWKGYELLSGHKFSNIRFGAKKRNIYFDIDSKFLWDLYIRQNKHCYLSSIKLDDINQSSLDRKDSTQGYIKNNVGWCHKDLNLIKADFSIQEFIEWCKDIIDPINNSEITLTHDIYCSFWKNIIHNADKRSINFQLTKQDLIDLYNKQQGRCAISNHNINLPSFCKEYRFRNFTASLDRIDNSIGYQVDNIQWVHKKINQSRKNLDLQYYKDLCQKVVFNLQSPG